MSRDDVIELTTFTLRMLNQWRQLLGALLGEEPDYETVLICLSVNSIGAERFMRTGLPAELRSLEHPLPPGMLGAVNVASIAAATGLNRETVRRKVAKLEQLGALERDEATGLRVPAELAGNQHIRDVVDAQKKEVFRLARRLKALEDTPAHQPSPRR